MKLKKLMCALAAVLSVTCIATLANAQDKKGEVPTSGLDYASSLSNEEMKEQSETSIKKMKVTLKDIIELVTLTRDLENATEGGGEGSKGNQDIIKLNCINDKLATIKGFVNVSEQSWDKLLSAIKNNDKDGAKHQFNLISIAGSKVNNLGELAQNCAGEALQYSGDTVVDKNIDPNIAQNDKTDPNNDGEGIIGFTTESMTPYN